MQTKHGAHVGVALLVGANHFLVVSFAQERQRDTVAAQRRLDDVGNVMLALLLIVVFQTLAGGS